MKMWRLLSNSVMIISNNGFRSTLILSFFKNWLHQTIYLFLPICFEQLATLVSCRFIAGGKKFSFGAAAWNGHCLIKEFESMKMLSKLPLRFYDLCSARPFRKKGDPLLCTKQNTVWKLRKFTITLFCQEFRESNVSLKKLRKSWFHEKYFCVSEFLVFPHCAEKYRRTSIQKRSKIDHHQIEDIFFSLPFIHRKKNFC